MANKELDVWREMEADFAKLQAELAEARAQIAVLREALELLVRGFGGEETAQHFAEYFDPDIANKIRSDMAEAREALAATPSDCLKQIKAEVLEDVAGHFGNDPQQQWSGFLVALEVRDMKDKP